MPQEQLDYRSQPAMPSRRTASLVIIVPAIILFGSATAVFVSLGFNWSSQLALDSRFSGHTDGLRFSVYLAWTAATLLFLGTCAAIAEFVCGRRAAEKRPAP